MKKLSDQEMADMLDNCRKATFLIEKQQTEGITDKEEAELDYHLNICEMCRVFAKQNAVINQFVKKLFGTEKCELKLDDSFKEELQRRINKKHDESSRLDLISNVFRNKIHDSFGNQPFLIYPHVIIRINRSYGCGCSIIILSMDHGNYAVTGSGGVRPINVNNMLTVEMEKCAYIFKIIIESSSHFLSTSKT